MHMTDIESIYRLIIRHIGWKGGRHGAWGMGQRANQLRMCELRWEGIRLVEQFSATVDSDLANARKWSARRGIDNE